jgi:glucosamine--fructose-6-phosphate aminotransferase (isomerizing)
MAKEILLEGLAQLEYRGYDSAGIALLADEGGAALNAGGAASTFSADSGVWPAALSGAGAMTAAEALGDTAHPTATGVRRRPTASHAGPSPITVIKKTGKVKGLRAYCGSLPVDGHCGIGHTRWATHGGVTDANAHPHQAGEITLIHNGIIENYQELIDTFHLQGKLLSQTDTEVAAWVLDALVREEVGDIAKAIARLLALIRGSYGFCILYASRPGEIYAVRNVSPLVASYTPSGALVASDLTAIIPYSRSYFVVPENALVRLTPYRIDVTGPEGDPITPEMLEVNWNVDAAMKNGYPHYMLKEIHEQPRAMENTILPRLDKGLPDFAQDGIPDAVFTGCERIHIIACGTAMHAGMVARSMYEPLLRIPVAVWVASEFRYEDPLVDGGTLAIVISQSGETIDTLAAMRLASEKGAATLSIVNVKGSTIARESDYAFYTHAGPEIAVASTKAYSVQLAALYLIGCRAAMLRGKYTPEEAKVFVTNLLDAIPAMEMMMGQKERIRGLTSHLIHEKDAFFIGRGLDYALSLEGALKLKEISYIHAEAHAAGELKHGTIALIAPLVPVVAIATQEHVFAKMISNIREVKARDAFVILVSKLSAPVGDGVANVRLSIPDLPDAFCVFPVVVFLQLLAYYAAVGKNLNVDQPRNLAKSVTVE